MRNLFPKLNEMKKYRTAIGLSRDEIARQVGISRSAITKYENGSQIPSYWIAVKIFQFLLDEYSKYQLKLADVMSTNVKTVTPKTTCGEVLNIMKKFNFTYIPIVQDQIIMGTISKKGIIHTFDGNYDPIKAKDQFVDEIMIDALPILNKNIYLKDVISLILRYNALLVVNLGELVGIITKTDLILDFHENY